MPTDDLLQGDTHQVLNQPTPLDDYNAFTADALVQQYVHTFGGDWGRERLHEYGRRVGHDLLRAGFDANRYRPEFETHDRFGHRIDQVNYHPAYHRLMAAAIDAGHHNLPWITDQPGAHVVRAAMAYLHTQADPGSGCPLTMTFACVPALKHQPDIAGDWLPKILSPDYDGRNIPYSDKTGVTIGMAMTEKQGGSDVRANTTRATPIDAAGPGRAYRLTGHKWFCSAPMCDAFLVLAQTHEGLSCFLLPRWCPDGRKNGLYFQRLKNKMGNVSNASAEVEYRGAFAWMIGAAGHGVRTILEMVALTRFDCMVGSSALMALATAQAIHHTGGRAAFGKNLHQQPLMQNVLADLALEWEASLAISLRLARALDHADSAGERDLFRIATAIGKYWICKRTAQHTFEAMESIGGVAVVEDNVLARLYREAPINAIWEGAGNIQCLDVLRAMRKQPETVNAFLTELDQAGGRFDAFDRQLDGLKITLRQPRIHESQLRRLVESMALVWQAATLIRYSDEPIAAAFVAGRLEQAHHMYGTLPDGIDLDSIIQRARPDIQAN